MRELQLLGQKHGTDKGDVHHTFAGRTYLDIYERYLSHLQNKPINFLEIGVRDGASHRMWSEFFSDDSGIYGIDIDPRCKAFEKDNIKVFIGSQASPELINSVAEDAGGCFDAIIDDGSHVNELTIKSFELLFPYLKSGGVYIIEDLACSYLEERLASDIVVGGWPGMQYNEGVEFVNKRSDMNSFFFDLIKKIDLADTSQYDWVHFYSKIAIIKKQ
tara:strand:- start:125 stop:775 length:651 start_codon:yes stop_codon:yes gene_type:complete